MRGIDENWRTIVRLAHIDITFYRTALWFWEM